MTVFNYFSTAEESEQNSPVPPRDSTSTSIVSDGAKIEGTVDLVSVDLRVEGTVHGDISTDGRVVVAEGADVEGTIKAHSIRVGGHVKGDMQAEETLVLAPSADVHATLEAEILEIQPGADFRGEVPDGPGRLHESTVAQTEDQAPDAEASQELAAASDQGQNGEGQEASAM